VDEIRALAVHYERNRDAINAKYTAIKRATRGVGKAPTTTTMNPDPVASKAIRAMGNDVPTEQSAAAAMAVHAARETAGADQTVT
jgi:hypothetical protein